MGTQLVTVGEVQVGQLLENFVDDSYVDSDCRYLGGDPRIDETGPAEIRLKPDGIRIEIQASRESEVIHLPSACITSVYFDAQRLGFEQAEAEEQILIDPFATFIRPTVVIMVKDPEQIYPDGFKIRLAVRNEYFGKVLEKRCSGLYNLLPF